MWVDVSQNQIYVNLTKSLIKEHRSKKAFASIEDNVGLYSILTYNADIGMGSRYREERI